MRLESRTVTRPSHSPRFTQNAGKEFCQKIINVFFHFVLPRPLGSKQNRSRVNMVMRLNDPELEARWLTESTARGLLHMKGHRIVGGVRISMYNGITMADVNRLRDFMINFHHQHQK